MSVTVIVDSTCDLTPEVAKQYGLEIMPINIAFGNETFQDGVNLTRASFFTKFKASRDLPVSSPPSVDQIADIFKKHLAAGREVLCLTISAALSETHKNAAAALASVGSDKVVLVDSKTLSGGVGLLGIVAGGLAQSGKSASQIKSAIETLRDNQRGFFTLPDLASLARSGRIGKAQVMLGTMMKIIPILRVNNATGVVEGEAQTRTFEKAKELVVEIAMRYIPKPADTRVVIAHVNDPALGASIEAHLRSKLSAPPKFLLVTEAGPAVAVHAGEGAIAIFSAEG